MCTGTVKEIDYSPFGRPLLVEVVECSVCHIRWTELASSPIRRRRRMHPFSLSLSPLLDRPPCVNALGRLQSPALLFAIPTGRPVATTTGSTIDDGDLFSAARVYIIILPPAVLRMISQRMLTNRSIDLADQSVRANACSCLITLYA